MGSFWSLIAMVFGIGYTPVGPGTFGSLAAALFLLMVKPSDITLSIVIGVTLVIGTVASHKAEKELGNKDDQHIVIDEFVGCMIACVFLPRTFWYILAGFILFRIFDIFKPPPIRQLQSVKGGVGIMIDDVAAGLAANLILQAINYILIRSV